MSWITNLYETYQNNISQIGIEKEHSAVLLPMFHLTTIANIEVTINLKGEYKRSRIITDPERIIIPTTEDSASKSGAMPKPHPLIDKLQYLAKDYELYGLKYHGYDEYIDLLKGWADYSQSSPMVRAIYQYVSDGTIINDLIEDNVFTIKDNQLEWGPMAEGKTQKLSPIESTIRWIVEDRAILGGETWKSNELRNNWINYYTSTLTETGLCYVLGKVVPLAMKHPKNIYNMCANAKIISANDGAGYTYRGRFSNPEESYGLSMEVSQKAHNALKWLVTRQGYNRGEKSIVAWSTADTKLPNVTADGYGILDELDDIGVLENDHGGYVATELSNKLRKKITGYRSDFKVDDKVNLIELESATSGRLSIIYYKEMSGVAFIERLEKWHDDLKWIHRYYNVKKSDEKYENIVFVGAPSPMNMAETAYGNKKNVDDKLKLKTVERILACMMEGSKIPIDLVQLSIRNVSNRVAFDKDWEFEKALSISCSLIRKYLIDYKGEEINMALDKNRTNRDYLYGRLLAVAQNVEQWALAKAQEKRMTNADRLMHRFSTHPHTTWATIEMSMKPYLEKLGGGAAASREKLIDEIMVLFDPDEFVDNRSLSGEFLLGYHCQREDFRRKKEVVAENHEENGGE